MKNRNNQIKSVNRNVNSRQTGVCKRKVLSIPIILYLSVFSFPLFSQSLDQKYQYIKELLAAKLTDQAQREIDKLALDAPNDPALTYYQTEVWYNKGEREYNAGHYNRALEYYDKASQFWSGNPLLSDRITSVKEKLKNHSSSKSTNQNTNEIPTSLNNAANLDIPSILGSGRVNINVFILDRETQEAFRLQSKEILEDNNPKNSVSIPRAYLLFFALIGFCLVIANLVGLFILIRGKEL